MQLATGQGGLEHVARIHRAFGLAGANHGVQLVNEQNDPPFLLGQLVEHGLEALFELTAELGAGNQRAHIQGQQTLVAQAVGHFTIDDALGQPFHDGGLAHTRLTDQYGVILGPTLQNLNGAANLVIAANHRIELALLGLGRQIDGVLVQRLARLFGVGIIDRLAAAQIVDRIFQRLLGDTLVQQNLAQGGIAFHRCQQHQLAGDELVVALLGQTVSLVEQPCHVLGEVDITCGIADGGQLVQRRIQGAAQGVGVEAHLTQQWLDRALLLVQQREQQMHRFDLGVVPADGQ